MAFIVYFLIKEKQPIVENIMDFIRNVNVNMAIIVKKVVRIMFYPEEKKK